MADNDCSSMYRENAMKLITTDSFINKYINKRTLKLIRQTKRSGKYLHKQQQQRGNNNRTLISTLSGGKSGWQ
jgi:hypothetical protein